jgi:hypothetical protein
VDLTAVTDEESWEVLVKLLNEQQKNELLANIATFVLSLPEVNTHVDDKKILKVTCTEIAALINSMLTKTAQLAEIPNFINPIAVQHDNDAAAYHGRGLSDIKGVLDEKALTIWTHLRGALHDYYGFITSASPTAWHCLTIAIVATLTVYQTIVHKVNTLFPGHTVSTLAGALLHNPQTLSSAGRSGGSGTSH